MKNTLTLDNPIKINGKEVTELTYDPNEITAAMFSVACARSSATNKTKSVTVQVKETDYSLHLYLGMMAVIAVNPEISIEDLERVHGFDVLDLTNIGSFFILRRSAVPSAESSSEEQSGNTPDTSTQA